ncbi:LolA family protein [Agromyces bauzanensis]
MSPRTTGPTSRRAFVLLPAIGVPFAVAVAVLVPMQANAAVDLPDKTVEELVDFARSSDVEALSGTIEQRSELGLPDLSAFTGGGAAGASSDDPDAPASAGLDDLLSLVTGSYDARVYLDGDNARLQVLDRMAERNVYVSPGEAWFVDSETQTATRLTLPEGTDLEQLKADAEAQAEAQAQAELPDAESLPTPQEVLDRALERLDETTEVSVGTDGRVAGRDAYELVLEPRTADTLVGEIRVAIDGENGAALAASITARGASDPAYSVGFSDVSFQAPDASVFAFEPADGFTVTEQVVPILTAEELEQWKAEAQAKADGAASDVPAPVVHGEGWTTVVELDADAALAAFAEHAADGSGEAGTSAEQLAEASAMLEALTQPVDGGRVLQTSLVTVLFTDDGRVLAGSVPADRLVDLAAGR